MGKEKKCTLYKKYTSYKKCIPYLILAGFTFFFCWWFVGRHGIFGAKVDWLSQHSVLPDYFRQQFYATGRYFRNLRRIWAEVRTFIILLITDYTVH